MNKKYDYILIVKPYPNTVLPAVMLKPGGAKLIVDIDDLDYGYRQGVISGIIRAMQKKLVPFADYMTSHNDELIKLIKREFPAYKNRIIKLNQCADTSVFSPKKVRKKNVKQIRSAYKGKKIFFKKKMLYCWLPGAAPCTAVTGKWFCVRACQAWLSLQALWN